MRAEYDAKILVDVSDEEAEEAWPEFRDEFRLDGEDFEDHRTEAAEWAARNKLRELIAKAPDYDCSVNQGGCNGVWEQ